MKSNLILLVLFFIAINQGITQNQKSNSNAIFKHTVYFDNNSFAAVDTELAKLSKVLDSIDTKDYNALLLTGYANNIGSDRHNQILSQKRASAVKNFIKEKNKNLSIVVKAMGEKNPIHNNDTELGLTLNRQVLVSFEKIIKSISVSGSVILKGKPMPNVKVFYKNESINDSTLTDKKGMFTFKANDQQPINVYTVEKNYFNQNQTFTPDAANEKKIVLELTPYELNKEINLTNILFYSNKNVVRAGVEDVLEGLTKNFIKNEDQCFEIQGHVNGQNNQADFTNYYKQLSEARAGTVYFYMKDHGIKNDRMVPVGYSNTKMLHPNNPTTEELIQNMRVVIKLLPCSEVKQKRMLFNEDSWSQLTKSAYFNKL